MGAHSEEENAPKANFKHGCSVHFQEPLWTFRKIYGSTGTNTDGLFHTLIGFPYLHHTIMNPLGFCGSIHSVLITYIQDIIERFGPILGTSSMCQNRNKIHINTGCPRRNVPDFGRVFLMLKYTDITQNTCVQRLTVMEIMAREVRNFDRCYTLVDYEIPGSNMWLL
jgi:hypothetical protein